MVLVLWKENSTRPGGRNRGYELSAVSYQQSAFSYQPSAFRTLNADD